MSRILFLFFLLLTLALLSRCQFQPPPKSSVLLVVVEGLDFESVPCLPGATEGSRFSSLCAESVRFSHAYTPSTMSQPALASILSARYPHEHGVRNNGSNFLSENFTTLPEVAVREGFRTSFFSGGAPIWRKSGFAQGFELFEDNIPLSKNRLYRSASQNFKLFEKWHKSLKSWQPFFSVIYLSDMQFPESVTTNRAGNERSLTRESQLEEIEESVNRLVAKLKAEKNWDNTYFVLAGLNGLRHRETEPLSSTNLFSENTHISLLVKPARAQRDQGIEWSVDVNVSLVDLGATLFNILGAKDITFYERSPAVVSFYSALERPSISWNQERIILTESDWANWRGIGSTRYGLRKNQWFFMNDYQPHIYNTLIDRYENNRILNKNSIAIEATTAFTQFVSQKQLPLWTPLSEEILQKLKIAKDWYQNKQLNDINLESLLHLYKKRPWDSELSSWLARHYISRNEWSALKSLAIRSQNMLWQYIADKKMNGTVERPDHSCLNLLNQRTESLGATDCKDPVFIHYARWFQSKKGKEKQTNAKRFLSAKHFRDIEKEISWHNYMNDLSWDTSLIGPADLDLIDLLYLLPEYPKVK